MSPVTLPPPPEDSRRRQHRYLLGAAALSATLVLALAAIDRGAASRHGNRACSNPEQTQGTGAH